MVSRRFSALMSKQLQKLYKGSKMMDVEANSMPKFPSRSKELSSPPRRAAGKYGKGWAPGEGEQPMAPARRSM